MAIAVLAPTERDQEQGVSGIAKPVTKMLKKNRRADDGQAPGKFRAQIDVEKVRNRPYLGRVQTPEETTLSPIMDSIDEEQG